MRRLLTPKKSENAYDAGVDGFAYLIPNLALSLVYLAAISGKEAHLLEQIAEQEGILFETQPAHLSELKRLYSLKEKMTRGLFLGTSSVPDVNPQMFLTS